MTSTGLYALNIRDRFKTLHVQIDDRRGRTCHSPAVAFLYDFAGDACRRSPQSSQVRPQEIATTFTTKEKVVMELGAFSVSLAVKNINASRDFYQKFGFETVAGDAEQNWLILKNGASVIGLFQGMFERNMLTFNPGWDGEANELHTFMDVRELQRRLKAQGVEFVSEADEEGTGPASFVAVDPDGNPILVDQHV